MMMRRLLYRPRLLPALVAVMATMGGIGCSHSQERSREAPGRGDRLACTADLRMPSGADFARARLLDMGRMTKVYVEMLRVDDVPDRRMLPVEMAQMVDITPMGLTRWFTDTIVKSRRFEVYDLRSTVTAENADVVVNAQVIAGTQEFKQQEGGIRIAHTRVRLSVHVKELYTGKYLGGSTEAEGKAGLVTGDRTVLKPGEDPDSPEVRKRLAADYQRALGRAFADAGRQIERMLRPHARVLSVEGRTVGVFGGSEHGLQTEDELVVFRAKKGKLGDRETFVSAPQPVALLRCEGVGTEVSRCQVRTCVADLQPQEGDYAVITDASLDKTRWE